MQNEEAMGSHTVLVTLGTHSWGSLRSDLDFPPLWLKLHYPAYFIRLHFCRWKQKQYLFHDHLLLVEGTRSCIGTFWRRKVDGSSFALIGVYHWTIFLSFFEQNLASCELTLKVFFLFAWQLWAHWIRVLVDHVGYKAVVFFFSFTTICILFSLILTSAEIKNNWFKLQGFSQETCKEFWCL